MDGKATTFLLVVLLIAAGLVISLVTSGQFERVLASVGVTLADPRLEVTYGAPGMPDDPVAVQARMEGFGLLEGTSDRTIIVDPDDRTITWRGSITDGSAWPEVSRRLQEQLPPEWEAWTQRISADQGGIKVGH